MKTKEQIKEITREKILSIKTLDRKVDRIREEAQISILRWVLDGEEVF